MEEIRKYRMVVGIMVVLVFFLAAQNILLQLGQQEAIETFNRYQEEQRLKELEKQQTISSEEKIDLGWELILANYETPIPEDYEFTLENYDASRKFDSRAISYLREMMSAAQKDGIKDMWAQSTYRSVETQKSIYDAKVKEYMRKGYSEEESKKLTEQTINKPGYSEHNLGLAVDFNYVTNDFEKTKGFSWMQEHAEEYGFILRYPKEKEEITKVKYESWHWRYVGKENAVKMNQLDMCLEEYIKYLEFCMQK